MKRRRHVAEIFSKFTWSWVVYARKERHNSSKVSIKEGAKHFYIYQDIKPSASYVGGMFLLFIFFSFENYAGGTIKVAQNKGI